MRVSHETIYRSLFIQARGVLKKRAACASAVPATHTPFAALACPRTAPRSNRRCHLHQGKTRRNRGPRHSRSLGGRFNGWHKEQSYRDLGRTPFAFYCAREGAKQRHGGCRSGTKPAGSKTPASLRRSLTWDRGLEMAKHKTFTVATSVKVYFCDPHSPWQRGTNENTNRLLRQYLPKRSDLSGYAQSELDQIAMRLNQRPRKTLGFETPASKLRARATPTH